MKKQAGGGEFRPSGMAKHPEWNALLPPVEYNPRNQFSHPNRPFVRPLLTGPADDLDTLDVIDVGGDVVYVFIKDSHATDVISRVSNLRFLAFPGPTLVTSSRWLA